MKHRDIELPDTEFKDCPEMGEPTFTVEPGLEKPKTNPFGLTRRTFLQRTAGTAMALGAADFLNYLLAHGAPNRGAAWAADVKGAAKQATEPRYLIYWYMEGGWESYDMFSPLDTPNNIFENNRLPMEKVSDERYRILQWGKPDYFIKEHGPLRV